MNKKFLSFAIVFYLMSHAIIQLKLDFIDLGFVKIEIERAISPITTERLMKKLPISTRGRYFFGGKDLFLIPIGVKKGLEKPKDSVERGEVVYEAGSDSMGICLTNTKTRMKVSKLGKVVDGLDIFEKLERSATVKITELK